MPEPFAAEAASAVLANAEVELQRIETSLAQANRDLTRALVVAIALVTLRVALVAGIIACTLAILFQ